ncbi:class I SAM-dependent methyltransferase [Aeromicrobium sp. P5_D10]
MTDSYQDINRAAWNERAAAHAQSPDYRFDEFRSDPEYISDVVRFDLPRLGSVDGLRGVHLQCHIGTDTISLARLGARMTGLDFSGASLAEGRRLAAELGHEIDFVEADLYAAPEVLPGGAFDLVFTGIGALGWLPDIRRWADVVARLLAPGGRLFLREGHPVLFSLADPRPDKLITIEHPYFEHEEPSTWDEPGTYVATDVEFEHTMSHEWNHGMGEIVTALLDAGLTITGLEDHDSAPWNALEGYTELLPNGEYRLIDRPGRLPMTYTLQAVKPR